MKYAKPFVKWAGGKTKLLPEIRKKYPVQLGKKILKYAEPFVGGGAVLFDILNRYNLEEIYISDINSELIYTYTAIRDNLPALAAGLAEMEAVYLSANEQSRKEIYYSNREKYNSIKASGSSTCELAALFIFLNRTCFNGLYRVNSKGGYNVPQGSYKNPCIYDAKNLKNVSNKLKQVNITHGDYSLAKSFIDDKTFAYFDPPYRPISATASFTSYSQECFDDNAQVRLANFIDEAANRGAYVLLSNSDPKNANEADNFFDNLYAKYEILRVEASRAINSIGSKRGKIQELLIANG
jgi:DNA adenine methylase